MQIAHGMETNGNAIAFLKQLCHNKGNIFFILFTNRCILVWRLGTLLHRRDRDTGTCCGCQLCI